MCGVEVKNTIKFDFPKGSARPTYGEIANFIKALDADLGQMEASYRIAEEKAMFIKFKTEEAMLYVLTHNSEDLIFHYVNGNPVEVHMLPAGDYVQYVRVYDLPPEVPDQNLRQVLENYGKVNRVVREKFPVEVDLDMYTGVRGVYMDVKKEIPSSLNFLNRKGNIFYEGNKDKCFLCKSEDHRMNSCHKRIRKQLVKHREQKQANGKTQSGGSPQGETYAAVVAVSVPLVDNSKETEDVIEVLDEEVVQMDVAASETTSIIEQEVQRPLNYYEQRQKRFADLAAYELAQKKKNSEKKTRTK